MIFTIANFIDCLIPLAVGILMIIVSFFDKKNRALLRKGGFIAIIVAIFLLLKHIFL